MIRGPVGSLGPHNRPLRVEEGREGPRTPSLASARTRGNVSARLSSCSFSQTPYCVEGGKGGVCPTRVSRGCPVWRDGTNHFSRLYYCYLRIIAYDYVCVVFRSSFVFFCFGFLFALEQTPGDCTRFCICMHCVVCTPTRFTPGLDDRRAIFITYAFTAIYRDVATINMIQ